MTEAKLNILTYLAIGQLWVTPTEIGRVCGQREASSWACRHLRVLMREGWVQRHEEVPDRGCILKVRYKITKAGLEALSREVRR